MPGTGETGRSAEPSPDQAGQRRRPGRDQADSGSAQGLAWSYDLDLDEVLAAIGAVRAGDPADLEDPTDQEASLAAELALVEASDAKPRDLTGVIADHLPAGPGLAAWLSNADPAVLADWDLAGVAAAYRRVASWAQSGELAAVAAIASRAAARDDKVDVDAEGMPDRISSAAASEVSLALAMTQNGASWWTGLAVAMRWRLRATGAALAAGVIDLSRARLIHEATARIPEETAQAVEAMVLPRAGEQTTAQLRVALRRAVIKADPEGAEERRKEAEFRAKVSLYSDDDGTATMAGSNLPGVQAAAAMARISAMARAMKASGAGGGLDLLRAQAFVGLLLGTLPLIPPPSGSPPDDPCGPADPDHGDGIDGDDGSGASDGLDGETPSPPPARSDPPAGSRQARRSPPGMPGSGLPANSDGVPSGDGTSAPDSTPARDSACNVPPPADADAPRDHDSGYGGEPSSGLLERDLDYEPAAWDHAPPWPPLPATIAEVPPVLGANSPTCPLPRPAAGPGGRPPPNGPPSGAETRRPPPGLLDLIIGWSTLAGCSEAPALLGRVGPITAPQARLLAMTAVPDPRAQWRVILIDSGGHALAVERVRRGKVCPRQDDRLAGTVGRVTVTVPVSALDQPWPATGTPEGGILTAVLRTGRRAAARADQVRAADERAAGGCAHTSSSSAYRPPPRIREFVEARDQTCRQPYCRQPAWRADLDHTHPWHKGGLTCTCNLGGNCRTHHQVKQQPGWSLTQPQPGHFEWTTPAGRTYRTEPDIYAT
jgi:hypothetical protein